MPEQQPAGPFARRAPGIVDHAPPREPSCGSVESIPALERWAAAVEAVRFSPRLRANILQSVMSSMAYEGFEVDREWSEALLEQALNGPPLEYPGRS